MTRSKNLLLVICVTIWLVGHAALAQSIDRTSTRKVDARRAAQVGIREIVGKHFRLSTDLPAGNDVDELPQIFDAAVDDWAEYFGIAPQKLRNWQMRGYLMQDRAKFAALGLLPKANPDFVHGFASGDQLWLMEQPSDYYRRHLLLHEGTHGFMIAQLGDTGPGWYMEGMAELFGTHRWQEGRLQMRDMPADRTLVPMWGRIKLIREACEADRALDLPAVLAIDKRRALSTGEYAWCWALCKFLDSHPRWQTKFWSLPKVVAQPRFNEHFRDLFHDDWADLTAEWRTFVAMLDYGYDFERMAMQHRQAAPVDAQATATIAAGRGWQSTGWLLRAGREVRVTAKGRYQIANDEDASVPWPCEPGGITIEYHDGRPLGILLGMLRSTVNNRFSPPIALGLAGSITPKSDAILYLRVNDSPARLSDNLGTLRATIALQ